MAYLYFNIFPDNGPFLVHSLESMKAKVWQARTSSPLFNTQIYADNLEHLFERMWDQYEKGMEPQHLVDDWDPRGNGLSNGKA